MLCCLWLKWALGILLWFMELFASFTVNYNFISHKVAAICLGFFFFFCRSNWMKGVQYFKVIFFRFIICFWFFFFFYFIDFLAFCFYRGYVNIVWRISVCDLFFLPYRHIPNRPMSYSIFNIMFYVCSSDQSLQSCRPKQWEIRVIR